ncbi:LysR family transcriptional regulator [Nocardia stercoris]|uniref:LysR family transcriptional regulator n=1 Tax=Nocardia stercoris TaxID=2483361 RepID=A0A3M2L782_9NOCA|nr:LysR family transcriptional regulator [Nocardia stercoris]
MLHIAQPVLSRQVQVLEKEFGGPLFVRSVWSTNGNPTSRRRQPAIRSVR